CATLLSEVHMAVKMVEGDATKIGDRKQLNTLCDVLGNRQASLDAANKVLADVRTRERELEKILRDKEAAFSQSELLKFIHARKYARNPLQFANAMAGLPDMGWHQS